MAARDKIYEPVLKALHNDHWDITDDPLILGYEEIRGLVDLGAERIIGAERMGDRIAIEIKSFIGASVVQDIEDMLGQHMLYQWLLKKLQSERKLYIAISEPVYLTIFQGKALQELIQELKIALVVVDLAERRIVKWIDI